MIKAFVFWIALLIRGLPSILCVACEESEFAVVVVRSTTLFENMKNRIFCRQTNALADYSALPVQDSSSEWADLFGGGKVLMLIVRAVWSQRVYARVASVRACGAF